jgi:Peptidase family M28
MLSGWLYRAALLPFAVVLAVTAFSLSSRPHPLVSTLAPDAFDGPRAFADVNALAREYPDRRPGSRADEALAQHIASTIRGLGGGASAGFSVRVRRFSANTIDGARTLQTVVAQRPGSTGSKPIVILAHRDAAAAGGAPAELSGTAALLELARVFASRETKRTLFLVSTSGGSGGNAGAADFAAHRASAGVRGPIDAALVLGNLAGEGARRPFVVPYSDGHGSAPATLQRTVENAIHSETGADPGTARALATLAHLVFPLAVGEQGPLNAAGIPAVLVQRSSERAPASAEQVSAARLTALGRSVLRAIDAIDAGADVPAAMERGPVVGRKVLPAWTARLLVLMLLFPPLVTAADAVARARRRRPSRRSVRRFVVWVLTCSLPFVAAALFARVLGAAGIVSVPAQPLAASPLALTGAAARATSAVALALALAWLAWPPLVARLSLRPRPRSEVAPLALELVLLALALLVWFANPFAALLLVPATHLCLLLLAPERPLRAAAALALLALALVLPALLGAFYAHQLALGPLRSAWMAVSLLAGGAVGVAAALAWSVALGCAVAAFLIALARVSPAPGNDAGEEQVDITIRGPLSYAGPGSLGGTESALRR